MTTFRNRPLPADLDFNRAFYVPISNDAVHPRSQDQRFAHRDLYQQLNLVDEIQLDKKGYVCVRTIWEIDWQDLWPYARDVHSDQRQYQLEPKSLARLLALLKVMRRYEPAEQSAPVTEHPDVLLAKIRASLTPGGNQSTPPFSSLPRRKAASTIGIPSTSHAQQPLEPKDRPSILNVRQSREARHPTTGQPPAAKPADVLEKLELKLRQLQGQITTHNGTAKEAAATLDGDMVECFAWSQPWFQILLPDGIGLDSLLSALEAARLTRKDLGDQFKDRLAYYDDRPLRDEQMTGHLGVYWQERVAEVEQELADIDAMKNKLRDCQKQMEYHVQYAAVLESWEVTVKEMITEQKAKERGAADGQ